MIKCNPAGICSWNYYLRGTGAGELAQLDFQWFREQGTIRANGVVYAVTKPTAFRGAWQLEEGDRIVAVARKPNAFTRRFEIEYQEQACVLEAQSSLLRTMWLSTPQGDGGKIAPVHPFTRRATMDIAGIPFHIQCFAFWLTVVTWKRSTTSASAFTASSASAAT